MHGAPEKGEAGGARESPSRCRVYNPHSRVAWHSEGQLEIGGREMASLREPEDE